MSELTGLDLSLFLLSGALGHAGFWMHFKGLHAFGMELVIFSCVLFTIFVAGLEDPADPEDQ